MNRLSLNTFSSVLIVLVALLAFTSTSGLLAPNQASAQTAPVQVTSNVQGTIGFGMVGAELGFFLPALFGLDELWSFIVFPIVGAAGGAVGGYFLFDQPNRVEGSVAMLATGMALAIPTLVAVLALTAYDPGDEGIDAEEADAAQAAEEAAEEAEFEAGDNDPAEVEVDGPAARRPASTQLADSRLRALGGGLLRVSNSGVGVGVPDIGIASVFDETEQARYGADAHTEYRLSLVSGSF